MKKLQNQHQAGFDWFKLDLESPGIIDAEDGLELVLDILDKEVV
ncbi:MAG: hypothetical protein AAF639_07060 [Chloroflexota bacterium]